MIYAEKPAIGLQLNSAADKFNTGYSRYSLLTNQVEISGVEIKRNHSSLGFSGVVVPFTFMDRQWAAGGGFRNVQDLTFKFDVPGNLGDNFVENEGIDAVSVGISGKVNENLSIGVVANDYIRGGESSRTYAKSYDYRIPGNTYSDTVDLDYNFNSHYSGVNFDLGLAGQFNMFKGGVVVHTPYDLKQTVKRTLLIAIPPTPIGTVDRYTEKISIPFSFSFGVAAKPIDKLTVAFDFDSRPMSSSSITVDYEMLSIQDLNIDPKWENLNQFRIGAEYMVSAGFASIPLRVGFRNNPLTAKEVISYTLSDSGVVSDTKYGNQINTNIISFGSGLHFQKAWIDLSYQFGNSKYNTVITSSTETTIENKFDYSQLLVSAGMNF